MQLKIAFHTMGGEGWTVGPIYLSDLFHALRQTYGSKVPLAILALAAQHDAEEYARSIGADELILYDPPRTWSFSWAINGLAKRLLLRDILLEAELKRSAIHVVFGVAIVHRYGRIATLSWLWDFQHVHLPEMFNNKERVFRTQLFLRSARAATRIILLSEAVRKDFEILAPMYAHKVRVLRPVSYIPPKIYNQDLNSILRLYHLPEKFIFLPNQFWKHKNHEIVFRAVKALKDHGVEITIVCSGSSFNSYHPGYFPDLFRKVSEWGIRDRIIYLGLIPREHVLLLIRQSVCVLNPSLFEGFGMTVEEARSLGKQVLLSDIPAHREQNPPKATFFNPHDCEDLVEKLEQIWKETVPGPDIELEVVARQSLPSQLRAYAESFISVAQETINEA